MFGLILYPLLLNMFVIIAGSLVIEQYLRVWKLSGLIPGQTMYFKFVVEALLS